METIVLVASVLFFVAVLISTMIFKVKDVNIGVPSSFFTGRIERDTDGNNQSVPIHIPYKEGLHLKRPWWSIQELSREVKSKPIIKRPFPVGKGGTVIVSGIIQFRISALAAYRYLEVDEEGIQSGLDSELDQVIRTTLVDEDVDSVITKATEISNTLWEKLTSSDIRTTEEVELSLDVRERMIGGKKISYAEHSYGIEILKAKIDTINPDENLKEARDNKQKEVFEKESQSTEFQHLLEKAALLKEKFPNIPEKEIWEAIQVWQKQTPKEVKTIRVEGTDTLTGILGILAGLGGKKND
ncbi:MAG: SPFH domain-containing protein [Candidatus Moraniibacteriota bacterium]